MKILAIADRAEVAGTRKTADGYLVAEVRVARGGNVQDYYGHEIGEGAPNQLFKIWRPEDEVFKADTLSTFAHRPVTLGHPDSNVTADTWRREAVGLTGGDVVRDGEFVRVPMMIADASAIQAVEQGTREISMGYECELVMQAGITPDGRAYDGFQRNHRMNHAAIVEAGRAGHQCRIGDSAARTNQEGKTMAKSVTIDGKSFEVADNVAALLAKGEVQEALVASAKLVGDAHAELATTRARADVSEKAVADLKAEVADLKAKAVTPADVEKMAAELVEVAAIAKALVPALDAKGKPVAEIKREVVVSLLGDSDKTKDAAYIDAAFDMLKSNKVGGDKVADAVKAAATNGTNDAGKTARDEYLARQQNAWSKSAA